MTAITVHSNQSEPRGYIAITLSSHDRHTYLAREPGLACDIANVSGAATVLVHHKPIVIYDNRVIPAGPLDDTLDGRPVVKIWQLQDSGLASHLYSRSKNLSSSEDRQRCAIAQAYVSTHYRNPVDITV